MAELNLWQLNNKKTLWTVLIASALTLTLYLVPLFAPLSYPFLLLSTLVHEMGHGIAALAVGGSFHSFKMWSDGSGVASISGNFGPFARAFVAAAGLVGPALVAGVFFIFVKSERRARMILGAFALILVVCLILVVRNLFGVFFVGLVAALSGYFSLYQAKYSPMVLSLFAAQLALSVFSRSDYLFKEYALTSAGMMPSDVGQMADALLLPYWFWGALCGLLSLAILAFGIRRIFK